MKNAETEDSARYTVFVRAWWRRNPSWPEGREPNGGAPKHRIGKNLSRREAVAMCSEWNATHKPGFLSRKAEFEQQ